MLRELEEAVKRRFCIASDREDERIVADDWESRLQISQVGKNNGHSDENVLVAILRVFQQCAFCLGVFLTFAETPIAL